MKYFEVKLYSQNGEKKKQISTKEITSSINFSEQLNGGQGNLTLGVVGFSSDFICGDIIEIREVNIGGVSGDNFWDNLLIWDNSGIWDTEGLWVNKKNEKVIGTYTGIIERIGVEEYKNGEILSIELLGVFTVLNDIKYKSGGLRTFVKTNTIGNIVKNIIDSFNSDYGVLSGDTQNLKTNIIKYSSSSIDISGDIVSINFDDVNCLEAIKKTVENSGFSFYIDEYGILFLQKEINQVLKYLTFDKEIVSISKMLKKDEMVNKFYLKRTGGVEKIYQDAPSISTFNLKEKSESNSDLQNEATQDIYGNTKILDYSSERNEISLTIKAQKNSFIKPGYLITTQNTKNQLFSKQITKIDKNSDFWKLYIGDFKSFGKTILKR